MSADYEEAKQQVADYAPEFMLIANRVERGRVETGDGRRIFDGELRDMYEPAEDRMNFLLEILHKHMLEEAA